jgi:hypothetical protein
LKHSLTLQMTVFFIIKEVKQAFCSIKYLNTITTRYLIPLSYFLD